MGGVVTRRAENLFKSKYHASQYAKVTYLNNPSRVILQKIMLIASFKMVHEGSLLDKCKRNLDTGQLVIFVVLHRFIDLK